MKAANVEVLRVHVARTLADLQQRYEADRNPMWCWQAIKTVVESLRHLQEGVIPPWVMEYLERVADGLGSIEPDTKGGHPAQIADAMELKTDAGRSAIRAWRNARQREQRDDARSLLEAKGDKGLLARNSAEAVLMGGMPSDIHEGRQTARGLYRGDGIDEESLRQHRDADRKAKARSKKKDN